MKPRGILFFILCAFSLFELFAEEVSSTQLLKGVHDRMNANIKAMLIEDDQVVVDNNKENLKTLKLLKDFWMPLSDRLKAMLQRQGEISTQTLTIDGESKRVDEIGRKQGVNVDQTEKALIYVDKLAQTKQKPRNSEKIQQALQTAMSLQEDFLSRLAMKDYSSLESLSENIKREIQKALDLLGKGKKQQSDSQEQKKSENSDKPQNQKSQGQQSERGDESSGKKDDSKNQQESPQKTMTEKEAKKELARLQQEADKRMKERRKALGTVLENRRAVEKDW